MARMITNILALFVLSVTGIEGARILGFFPTPSISHQVVFRPIIHELARRGHEVIVVTPDPVYPKGKAPANLTEIDVRDASYSKWQELFVHHNGKKQDLMLQVTLIFERFATIFDSQMETPEVKNMFKNKDRKYFDLLILEACNRPLMGLTHVFDAPVIVISSFGAVPLQYSSLGAPTHPLLYPTPGRQRLYNLSLWERGLELLKHVGLEFLIAHTEEFDNQIMRKHFGNDVPTYEVLRKKIQMMFLNEHPIWADNRPVPPSIVYIGGIHQSVEKELPKDLKNYLDSSKNGVIYVSFGTNVLPSILPPEKIQIMTKVLSELPYDVLWKWDKDTLPGQSKNMKISKWFPQTDVLNHPNVKLFVTQGGLQSTDEAIDATVPLIGIPMLGDQWYNVEKYVHLKIGLQHDLMTLTENDFKSSIKTVIEDKSFKENIIRLKKLMRSYAIKPADNAVWWVEHVLKYGGSHLRSPASDISWVDYYEIKLVLLTLAIIMSILIFLGIIIKLIISIVYKLLKNNIKVKTH
ncbi:UDP-glucosyltransferase 2-like [Vanessa atalanta]|uniref:UDP-glucosyltransferase 2-like n=1 Tax=Vanessa atalanta TaxID=42275 RepID=UPI001FCCF15A|nr:UDP-glucosyltransferase 2-like [Vanessa atalanta]